MSPQANPALSADLRKSYEAVSESLAGMTEEDARRNPAAGRWSAIDCLEHLVNAEASMRGRLESGVMLPGPIDVPEREAGFSAIANRTGRRRSPPHAEPKGRFAFLADALTEFSQERDRTIAHVEAAHDLRWLQVIHPVFGPISGHEMVLVMIAHPMRHAAQILEIRQQLK